MNERLTRPPVERESFEGGVAMPFIRVTSFPQSQEARAEMAEGITEVVHRVTKIPKDYIWLVFEPTPQESWSVGGTLVSEKK